MLDEKPEELSDGEQQRLLLAAHLDPAQPLWLLDEADVHLDEAGFIQLGKAVVKHQARGGLVIVVAHRHARWSPIADEIIEMEVGETPIELPICEAPSTRGEQEWTPPEISLFSNQVEPVRAGDLIVITGENGTGKTTLLREWAAADGIVWLPTSPDRRLLGMTVGEELTLQHPLLLQAAKLVDGANLGNDAGEEVNRLQIRQSRLRLDLGLSRIADATPVHDLSCGERRRLSLLPLLISEPRIMLLDEIDHALDDSMLAELLRLLGKARADGCALILTSHSPDLALWASMSGGRRWLIENEVLSEVKA
jgi:ABC-type transport system involved in cytochrome c biogenesis ATPase subunit